MKRRTLLFNKQMMAEILGVKKRDLDLFIPEEIKNEIGYNLEGRFNRFTDEQVYKVIKHFRKLATHEEIVKIIHPNGY